VFCFVEGLATRDGVTIGIGLSRALECSVSVGVGLSLGVLDCAGRRLVMKQPLDGLWSGRAVPGAGRCVPDPLLELRDLRRAWPAMAAPPAQSSAAPVVAGRHRRAARWTYAMNSPC
jgi:hypothetical protein